MRIQKLAACLIAAFSFLIPLGACAQNDGKNDGQNTLPPEAQAPALPEIEPVPTPTPEPEPAPTPDPEPEPEPEPQEETAVYVRLTGDGVNLRSGQGTSYAALGSGEEGSMYAVKDYSNGWYAVSYKNKTAYIYERYAREFEIEKSENKKIEAVLEKGYTALGVPYVYGATRLHDGTGKLIKGFSPKKFDCSSLVQYAFYYGAGAILGTTTRTQVRQGKPVKRSDLQRGDCIYFTNAERYYKTGIERVGHVAVYLGDNYILHTSSDYARIEPISQKRWSYYIEARRFV